MLGPDTAAGIALLLIGITFSMLTPVYWFYCVNSETSKMICCAPVVMNIALCMTGIALIIFGETN